MLRRALLVLSVAGCASGGGKAPQAPCPPAAEPAEVAATAQSVAKAPELDDPAVVSQSHAFMDANDKADLAAFSALAGSSYVRFARSRFFDRAYYEKEMPARAARKVPPLQRTCTQEKVYRTATSAIYVGACVVSLPAQGEQPAATIEGWDTLVWLAEGAAWKVAHWQWQRAGLEAEREDWNDTFRTSTGFKKTANQFLVDVTKGRRPGTALDIAAGQGRNALHLAAQKWKVTAVDISNEGLRIAKEAAAAQKLKLETVQQDIAQYELGTGKWDLVTLIYAGNDPKLVERIKASIRRGGMFVVEFFHKEARAGTGIGGFGTGELAQQFAGWKIVRDEVVEDTADWGLRKTKLVRFAAEKP